jgi:long-chain acyl-CoA synthetase
MPELRTLLDCALHWERTAGDRRWLTQPMGGGRLATWTWKEGMDEVRRMAAYLDGLRLPPGSSVALCSKNCAWWILADLAISMAGHVSVPLYPVLTADTVRYVLEHSQATLLFVGKLDPVWEEMRRGVPPGLPCVAFPLSPASDALRWDDVVAARAPMAAPVARSPEEVATIVYTSGSTGQPKGAMSSFRSMCAVGRAMADYCGTTPADRALSYLPLAHCYERAWGEANGLHGGAQLFFPESVETFLEDLRRARPTLFVSVPRLWMKFQAGVFEKVPPAKLDRLLGIPVLGRLVKRKVLRQLGLDRVRLAGSGSAPIPAEVIAWYRRLGLELREGYAMTENFAYSHSARAGQVRPGYVGVPLPGVECRLSEAGEVLVKSPGNVLGYFRDPARTAEMFTPDGFLRTGDRGELDADGRLRITGRIKELFKTTKGKYVAPAPLENRIVGRAGIEQCCVCGSGQPQPHAIVVLSDEARRRVAREGPSAVEQELAELLRRVNRDLPPYERLEFLAVIDDAWLPENGFLTPTLKVKRARIEETYGPFARSWYDLKRAVVWQGGAGRGAAPRSAPAPGGATDETGDDGGRGDEPGVMPGQSGTPRRN